MTSVYAVRVFITPDTSPEKTCALLHAIANFIAKDGFTFHQPELEGRDTVEKSCHRTEEPF